MSDKALGNWPPPGVTRICRERACQHADRRRGPQLGRRRVEPVPCHGLDQTVHGQRFPVGPHQEWARRTATVAFSPKGSATLLASRSGSASAPSTMS